MLSTPQAMSTALGMDLKIRILSDKNFLPAVAEDVEDRPQEASSR